MAMRSSSSVVVIERECLPCGRRRQWGRTGPASAVGVRAALVAPVGYKCVKIIASWSHARLGSTWEVRTGPVTVTEVLAASPGPTGRSGRTTTRVVVVVFAIIGFLILGGFEAWHDSATFDEPVYVSSGVVAVLHHDVADNAEHPPLFKVLAALPVLAVGPGRPRGWALERQQRAHLQRPLRPGAAAGGHDAPSHVRLPPRAAARVRVARPRPLRAGLPALRACGRAWWPRCCGCSIPLVLGLGHLDGVDLPFALTTVLVSWAVGALVAPARSGGRCSGSVPPAGRPCRRRPPGLLVGAVALGVIVAAGPRSGRRGWPLWRQPLVVALVAWVLVWAVYIVLDPSVVLHSWLILPQPYVEGLKYLASNDTGGVARLPARRGLDGGERLVLARHPVGEALHADPGPAGGRSRRPGRPGPFGTDQPVDLAPDPGRGGPSGPGPLRLRAAQPAHARGSLPPALHRAVDRGRVADRPGGRPPARRRWSSAVVLAAAAAVTVLSFPALDRLHGPAVPARATGWPPTPTWTGVRTSAFWRTWSRGRHPYVAYFGPRGITDADIPGSRPLVGVAPARISGWVAASASDLTERRSELTRAGCGPTVPVGTLGGSILLYHFTTPPTSGPRSGDAGAAVRWDQSVTGWRQELTGGSVRRAPCVGSCAARASRRRR